MVNPPPPPPPTHTHTHTGRELLARTRPNLLISGAGLLDGPSQTGSMEIATRDVVLGSSFCKAAEEL